MSLNANKIVVMLIVILLTVLVCNAQQPEKIKEVSLDEQTADLTLLSASKELRDVKDLSARVSLVGSIVSLLAKSRPASCTEMLDEIFQEALKKKKELESPIKSAKDAEPKKEKALDPDAVILSLIKIAGKFDPALAKKYTEEYTAEKDAKNNSPLRDQLKLKIASELIESDPQAAVSLATEALRSGVTMDVLVFLTKLRERNVALADNFALIALRNIEAMHSSDDVNELLVMFAFILTPQLVPGIISDGMVFHNIPEYEDIGGSYPPNPALSRQFMQSSLKILLASNRYLQGNFSERAFADFYLLSMLEYYAPTVDLGATIQKQKNAITQYLRPEQIQNATIQIGRWNELRLKAAVTKAKAMPRDADYFSKRAEQEKDPKLKDRFYYHAAASAVREKRYDEALELVRNISIDNREKAQGFINYQIAWQSIRDGKIEQAEKYLAKDNNQPRRAFLLTLMAEAFVSNERKDSSRSSELLSQVTTIASHLDTDKEKAAVLFGAAKVYSEFDSGKAFEVLGNALQAANKLENFDGECFIYSGIEFSGFYFDYTLYHTELTFMEAIERLSKANFGQTLQYLRDIKNPLPRLQAVVLACKTPLVKSVNSKN